jgi:hypothetical protein
LFATLEEITRRRLSGLRALGKQTAPHLAARYLALSKAIGQHALARSVADGEMLGASFALRLRASHYLVGEKCAVADLARARFVRETRTAADGAALKMFRCSPLSADVAPAKKPTQNKPTGLAVFFEKVLADPTVGHGALLDLIRQEKRAGLIADAIFAGQARAT